MTSKPQIRTKHKEKLVNIELLRACASALDALEKAIKYNFGLAISITDAHRMQLKARQMLDLAWMRKQCPACLKYFETTRSNKQCCGRGCNTAYQNQRRLESGYFKTRREISR